jgi:tRNA (cmo5U34)-methyltransferase
LNNDHTNKRQLEKMIDFFTSRIDIYEDLMLTECGKAGYKKLAELVPVNTSKILDLGCGTGLELDEIFNRFPHLSVEGIDLTPAMLDRLKLKYPGHKIKLICGSFFDVDFGESTFDTAISFKTMHHFSHDEKVELYGKIRKALRSNGVYIECDNMVMDQTLEDELYAENARLRHELNIPPGEFYHFDTPCTVDNQIAMFKLAGFSSAEMVFRMERVTIIFARK